MRTILHLTLFFSIVSTCAAESIEKLLYESNVEVELAQKIYDEFSKSPISIGYGGDAISIRRVPDVKGFRKMSDFFLTYCQKGTEEHVQVFECLKDESCLYKFNLSEESLKLPCG